jgi:hypothetical protein
MNDDFAGLKKWSFADSLISNSDKTNVIKLSTSSKTCINLNMGYDNKIKNNQN